MSRFKYFITSFLFLYLAFSFFTINFDFRNWGTEGRFFFLFFLFFIIIGILNIKNNDNSNTRIT